MTTFRFSRGERLAFLLVVPGLRLLGLLLDTLTNHAFGESPVGHVAGTCAVIVGLCCLLLAIFGYMTIGGPPDA